MEPSREQYNQGSSTELLIQLTVDRRKCNSTHAARAAVIPARAWDHSEEFLSRAREAVVRRASITNVCLSEALNFFSSQWHSQILCVGWTMLRSHGTSKFLLLEPLRRGNVSYFRFSRISRYMFLCGFGVSYIPAASLNSNNLCLWRHIYSYPDLRPCLDSRLGGRAHLATTATAAQRPLVSRREIYPTRMQLCDVRIPFREFKS